MIGDKYFHFTYHQVATGTTYLVDNFTWNGESNVLITTTPAISGCCDLSIDFPICTMLTFDWKKAIDDNLSSIVTMLVLNDTLHKIKNSKESVVINVPITNNIELLFSKMNGRLHCTFIKTQSEILENLMDIVMFSIVTHILAIHTDLEPGVISWVIQKMIVYNRHMNAFYKICDDMEISDKLFELHINKKSSINSYDSDDFDIPGYEESVQNIKYKNLLINGKFTTPKPISK